MKKEDRYPDTDTDISPIHSAPVTAGFFETLLMNANVWITYLDTKGRIGIWNTAAEDITGYGKEDVIGHNDIWKKLYPDPEYRREVTEKIDEAIQNRRTLENFETVVLTRGGEYRYISWNTREIREDTGNTLGYIAIGRDITDKVTMGKKFRTLLMNANVWVAFLDADTNIEVWNRAAEMISGYRADEVVGTNEVWKNLYPDPDYRKDVTEQIRDHISNKKELENFESKITSRSGEEKIISWNTRALEGHTGRILGYIMTGSDVTHERKMQAEFVGYLGESAMRLKNPVEVIKENMDQLAVRMEAGECPPEDCILQIRIQAKNAEQIIGNLSELNHAISIAFEDMPAELRDFLSG